MSLSAEPDIRVLDDCTSCPGGVVRCTSGTSPRVILLDPLLIDVLAPACLGAWHAAPNVKVLVWCDSAEMLVEHILAHGFRGYVLATDSPSICLKAIRAVARGELWIPRAQLADAVARRLAPDPQSPSHGDPAVTAAPPLTLREAEVVAQVRQGATNKEIARRLGIMEDTVKKHLQSAFGKLGVHRRGLVMLRQPLP